MLEAGVDQGAGLRRQMPQTDVRLLPIIQHSNQSYEPQLLWQLCHAMSRLGHAVVVLDTTTAETPDKPGLIQLMDEALSLTELTDSDLPWAIIPARWGWQRLSYGRSLGPHALDMMARHFGPDGVALIYGQASVVGPAFSHSGVRPLVGIGPEPQHLLSAYTAMKLLVQDALLLPTAAVMVTQPTTSVVRQALQLRKTLKECAVRHIGCELDSVTIQSYAQEEAVGRDMQMLALRLLEHAVIISEGSATAQTARQPEEGLFVRSH